MRIYSAVPIGIGTLDENGDAAKPWGRKIHRPRAPSAPSKRTPVVPTAFSRFMFLVEFDQKVHRTRWLPALNAETIASQVLRVISDELARVFDPGRPSQPQANQASAPTAGNSKIPMTQPSLAVPLNAGSVAAR